MRSIVEYIFEAQLKADRWKSYNLRKIKTEFKKLGYLDYGFIHLFDERHIKLDYPGLYEPHKGQEGLDLRYEESDIKYCPVDLYAKPRESAYRNAIDIARASGYNECYATFDNDKYGVFFSKELKYFYTVKLTDQNVKVMKELDYIKDRTENLKTDFEELQAKRKKEELEKKKKAEENQKNKAEFEKFSKMVDKAKEKGKELFKLYQKNPDAFEEVSTEIRCKIRDIQNKTKKIIVDGEFEEMNPRELYPSYDIRLSYDDPYGKSDWIRLIQIDGKNYRYDFQTSTYPSDYYWGD